MFGVSETEILVFDLTALNQDFTVSKVPISKFSPNPANSKLKSLSISEQPDNHTTTVT